jgi:hypothetical protein
MIENNEELRVLLADFLGYDEKTNLSELLSVLKNKYGIVIYKLSTVSEEGLKEFIMKQKQKTEQNS